MAVVTAVELDDFVAFGEAARQPDGRHRRFRAGIAHANFFNARNRVHDQTRHRHLQWIRNAEACAVLDRLLHRFDYRRERVPMNRRAPRADVIDVGIVIDVVNVRPLRALNDSLRI